MDTILVVICVRTIISLWLKSRIGNLKDPAGCSLLFAAWRLGANWTWDMPPSIHCISNCNTSLHHGPAQCTSGRLGWFDVGSIWLLHWTVRGLVHHHVQCRRGPTFLSPASSVLSQNLVQMEPVCRRAQFHFLPNWRPKCAPEPMWRWKSYWEIILHC